MFGHRPQYKANDDEAELSCVFNIARLLPDGCCCLNDMRNKIFFRINWP